MIVKNGDLILSPKNTDSKGSSHNERKTNWPSCKARELGTSLFRHAYASYACCLRPGAPFRECSCSNQETKTLKQNLKQCKQANFPNHKRASGIG